MSTINLIPAYGRDYTNAAGVRADFLADKDFIVCDISSRWDGKPVNRPQLKQAGVTSVTIRYNDNRKVLEASKELQA